MGAGARLAFDVNKASWGFTPILNHGLLKVGSGSTLFGELVVPVRFQENVFGKSYASIGLGVHVGVGFQGIDAWTLNGLRSDYDRSP